MKYLLIILVCFSCCGTKGTKEPVTATPNPSTPGNVVTDPTNSNGNSKSDTSAIATGASTVSPVNSNKKIALRFGSLASGPIGEDFLKAWLEKFNRDESAAITAEKFSGCGKEGEYIIVISKNNFSRPTDDKFTSGLEKLVADEIKRTKAISSSSGSVEIINDPNTEEYSYCRLGSKKWL